MNNKLLKGIAAVSLMTSSLTMNMTNVFAENTDNTATKIAEQFAQPESSYKPLTRWWVPGDLMTKEEIRNELKSMYDAGFGGAEVVPVSIQGGDGEGSIGWGTERWKELTKYMLDTAGEFDMTIDFTMTPAWPLALPTITDVDSADGGAQREMDGAYVDGITKENPFNGKLPVSEEAENDADKVNGTVVLEAVTIAKYADKENAVLDLESAISVDLNQIQDGEYSFTPEDDGEYVLYAWYAHPSGNTKYENNQVDHYSKAGTQAIIDYWENELIPYYGESFENVRSLFIDSLEFETHLDWTFDMLEGFRESKGYDLTPYLPALYDEDAIGNYMGDPEPDFSFDENSEQIRNDFKQYLTELYIENHIQPLEEFCASHGITLRYQTSYGKNLEVTETALYPDIPETETLYGGDFLDFYRLQSGAVHVGDKTIYSLETAAEWTETWNAPKENGLYGTRGNGENNSGNYEQTFKDHLWHDQRAFAAGVNQVVFHGYPYNGQYDGEGSVDGLIDGLEWGGFTGFPIDRWSNSWGERQPNWQLANTYLSYITRLQYVLRQGKADVDLAIYNQSYYELIDFWGNQKVYDSTELEQNGYTYDFVAPLLFEQDGMEVENGVLNADGPSYKALVLNNQTDIPYATFEHIVEYAEAGLPIVVIGEMVQESSYYEDQDMTALIERFNACESVIQVASMDDVVTALKEAGVEADAAYSAAMVSTHRADDDADYYYLYNYGDASNYQEAQLLNNVKTEVTLQGEGKPYYLNAWNGEMTPVVDYTVNEGSVTLTVDVAGNDSVIVALVHDVTADDNIHSEDFTLEYVNDEVIVKGNGQGTVTVAEETRTINLPEAEDAQTLSNWNLRVESWTKGETAVDTEKTVIEVGTLDELKTWNEIEGLEDVSGVGVYTTTFDLEKGWDEGQGAILHVGNIKDAYEIKINDTVVSASQMAKDIDVGTYLKAGTNTIEVTVATALLNAMLVEHPEDLRSPDQYGLPEEFVLTPYAWTNALDHANEVNTNNYMGIVIGIAAVALAGVVILLNKKNKAAN